MENLRNTIIYPPGTQTAHTTSSAYEYRRKWQETYAPSAIEPPAELGQERAEIIVPELPAELGIEQYLITPTEQTVQRF